MKKDADLRMYGTYRAGLASTRGTTNDGMMAGVRD